LPAQSSPRCGPLESVAVMGRYLARPCVNVRIASIDCVDQCGLWSMPSHPPQAWPSKLTARKPECCRVPGRRRETFEPAAPAANWMDWPTVIDDGTVGARPVESSSARNATPQMKNPHGPPARKERLPAFNRLGRQLPDRDSVMRQYAALVSATAPPVCNARQFADLN
jgi:hypothetical protein